MSESAAGDAPLGVSELTQQIKQLLQATFAKVKVVGEIADLARPRSGHVYLTLKDDHAQIKAVIWRSTAQRLKAELSDGLEVVATGYIDVYPPRGAYQLIIQSLVGVGTGALERKLRELREKLAAEGLFDAQWKKPLPVFPRTIGVITSPTSAALRDYLEVLGRRWRQSRVWVIPAQMQGDTAAEEVIQGLRLAHRVRPRPDVLVVTRGGGSIEDLWAFNDERLVREVFAAEIPVVSAIGHEIDVTLCDLVADMRALTPSEAAERTVPDSSEFARRLHADQQRLLYALQRRLQHAKMRLQMAAERPVMRRPAEMVHERQQMLDEWQQRLERAVRERLADAARAVTRWEDRLTALNPKAVLQRGYSITLSADRRQVITSREQVQSGERIRTVVADGEFESVVEKKQED